MDEYISRQAAIDALHVHLIYRMGTESNKKRLDEWINSLPSAQPELVRCKDCIYFTPEKSGEHWNVCRFYDAPKTADGYCNDAERKEE